MKKGIDVSRWQGQIDWCKASKVIDFAILKIGGSDGGIYRDKYYDTNYLGAKAHNVPVGVYFFMGSDCNNADKGRALAVNILKMIANDSYEYPVYLDVEGTNIVEKDGVTDAVYECCRTLEEVGFYVGVYGSDVSTFRDRLNADALARFDKWVARYPLESTCTVIKSCGMRQYSSSGKIDGIQGNVDLDIAYYDFPAIIKGKHLNGF